MEIKFEVVIKLQNDGTVDRDFIRKSIELGINAMVDAGEMTPDDENHASFMSASINDMVS